MTFVCFRTARGFCELISLKMGTLLSSMKPTMSILARSAVLDFGIQWGLFAIAAALKTEKFYDLAGSSTFLLLTYQTLKWGGTFHFRQVVQSGMVGVWALRLGMYLFSRVLNEGEDRRFRQAKNNLGLFFFFWTMQAVWVWLTLLPTQILNAQTNDRPLTKRDYVGWGMFVVGLLLEIVADYQKAVFRADPDNTGKFINTGLWSISRHPNYLGEIILWAGLYISASSVMTGKQYLSVISPIFVYLLLTRVSGIPLLERYGLKKWGNSNLYQEYLKKTPVLWPKFW
ncbi:uncharacterized protein LOC110973462 [Acanthaster planci]|uniref:Uncharacterized protein LOC110973462 n=1 Tax=Acanthaster planci TaxID=133434 RepID=A0A8B7XJ84_ACAPL|nr:uncharacterized protein LOC110973462 [Acanthaster planci]